MLPTGGGKSICDQLLALVHYRRAGQLTVIVPPLQSLMKDRVDKLVQPAVRSSGDACFAAFTRPCSE